MESSAYVLPEALPGFSWKAVFAGAAVASAVTLFLLMLGTGVGMSLLSAPPANGHAAASALTLGGIYFFASQAFGLVVGGYLAGRLMGPVLETESEEIFHASAHGLVVWAVAVVATLAIIALSAVAGAGSALNGSAQYLTANMPAASSAGPAGYWVDTLFRASPGAAPAAADANPATPTLQTGTPPADRAPTDVRGEAGRIITAGGGLTGQLSRADHDQLASLVSRFAGLSAADAGHRVDDVLARIRQQEVAATQAARKATEYVSLLLAASLIFGGLVSAGAAVSGRWTDDHARGIED
jgi:amino acid transporter